MAFEISKAYSLVHKAMDYRALRQDLIASNLANVATPFYRPQDIAFEAYLTNEANRIFKNEPNKTLPLAQTNAGHLPPIDYSTNRPSIFWRDGHLARNDGNSVDLDVETSEMGKNSVMYNALISSSKKHKGIYAYMIESGKNI